MRKEKNHKILQTVNLANFWRNNFSVAYSYAYRNRDIFFKSSKNDFKHSNITLIEF